MFQTNTEHCCVENTGVVLATPPSPCTTLPKLNCKVSSDAEELQKLHEKYPWVPGKENIRPAPENKERKHEYLETVCAQYASEGDYVLQTVFGIAPEKGPDGKYFVPRDKLRKMSVFDRNLFPYMLPQGTRHFIMWYTFGPDGLPEEQVTKDIAAALAIRVKHATPEFVWYENPKMTIPTVYHVQVFWHTP